MTSSQPVRAASYVDSTACASPHGHPSPVYEPPVNGAFDRSARGFTLIEMVVVIAIILLLAGIVVPSASTLWNERKMSGTVNMMQGLFMTTRVRAMQPDSAETGFFVYLDDEGDQRIVRIERPSGALGDPAWQNVFSISEEREQVLPKPIRIVPRYAVIQSGGSIPSHEVFDEDELANNFFAADPSGDQSQRQRNFFSVIYSTDGELVVNRDVLILDEDQDGDGVGDRTGMAVGLGPTLADPSEVPTVNKYYGRDGTKFGILNAFLFPNPIKFLIRDPDPSNVTVALNFPSVDGLLVYDDVLFNGLTDAAAKRNFLLDTAKPLYVSRYTGMIIRGPVGENN